MDEFKQLQQRMSDFVEEREWTKYHSPKNLSMSISIEAAELMELFQWLDNDEASKRVFDDENLRQNVKDELADVMIYCLSLANCARINLKKAISAKMDRNNHRFPIGKSID